MKTYCSGFGNANIAISDMQSENRFSTQPPAKCSWIWCFSARGQLRRRADKDMWQTVTVDLDQMCSLIIGWTRFHNPSDNESKGRRLCSLCNFSNQTHKQVQVNLQYTKITKSTRAPVKNVRKCSYSKMTNLSKNNRSRPLLALQGWKFIMSQNRQHAILVWQRFYVLH